MGAPSGPTALPPADRSRATPPATSHSCRVSNVHVASARPAATRASRYAIEPRGTTATSGRSNAFHFPCLCSLRLTSNRGTPVLSLPSPRVFTDPEVRRPVSLEPQNISPVLGFNTPPATASLFLTKPIDTHHSGQPSTNSRVPSIGSTTHTREAQSL